MMALEIDPGSIASSTMQLFNLPIYNQHNGFHTRSYGWVFTDINFVVIFWLKVIGQWFGFYDKPIFSADYIPIFLGAMRATTFTMGLISVIIFFKLSNLLFRNKKLAFLTTLFFMFDPLGSKFSYFVHPETTGMVFTLMAIWYLVKFLKNSKVGYFYLSYISLVLTALSKQTFSFIFVPVLLIFFFSSCDQKKLTCFEWSKQFLKVLFQLIGIGILILLLVHPYAIIEPAKFYASQQAVAGNHQSTITFAQSFYTWLAIYQNQFLIKINVAFFVLLSAYMFLRKVFSVHFLFIVSVIFCNVFLLVLIYGARLIVTPTYLYPILPLLILNVVAVIIFIWEKLARLSKGKYWQLAFALMVTIYLLPIFSANVLITTNALLNRITYKNTTNYQARQFILDNIPAESSIVYDPSIPIPKNHTNSCNSWNCFPNDVTGFILLHKDYQWVDHKPVYQYIADHQFELLKKIEANTTINSPTDSFWQTKEWVRLWCDPNWLIGPNILIYQKKMK